MSQPRHIELDLAELKSSVVHMGQLVERALSTAVEAISRPTTLAREQCRIIEGQLDTLENAIGTRCHEILALQQPVASELRLVLAAMRITSDLEQIGDFAEGVAKRASFIASNHPVETPHALVELGGMTVRMVHEALEGFISGNLQLARGVIISENIADSLTKQCYKDIQRSMQEQLETIREYTHLVRAAALLECIADVAVSISEESIYIYRGTNVRHHHDEMPVA